MGHLIPITSPALILAYSGGHLTDIHMEDPAVPDPFYVLELDGPAPMQFGVHEGEPWFRAVWMWESTREADLALAEVAPEVEGFFAAAVAAVREHIAEAESLQSAQDRVERLDIGRLLAPVGWPMRAVLGTKAEAAVGLAIYKRLLRQRPTSTPA